MKKLIVVLFLFLTSMLQAQEFPYRQYPEAIGKEVGNMVKHFTSGYYSKWEAEDTIANSGSGLKTFFGYKASYQTSNCWTSGSDEKNAGKVLLSGPNYRQDKFYKLDYMSSMDIIYELKFRIAGAYLYPSFNTQQDSICKISVVFTYMHDGILKNDTLGNLTLYSDTLSNEFKTFVLRYTYPFELYRYHLALPGEDKNRFAGYTDNFPGGGIQFIITWYGKMQIYIDYLEVYDDNIGNSLVYNPKDVEQTITNFIYKYNGWKMLEGNSGDSELTTIDSYLPVKKVNEILNKLSFPHENINIKLLKD